MCLNPKSNKVIITKNITFFEDDFLYGPVEVVVSPPQRSSGEPHDIVLVPIPANVITVSPSNQLIATSQLARSAEHNCTKSAARALSSRTCYDNQTAVWDLEAESKLLQIFAQSLVPTRLAKALEDPDWKDAMLSEYNALVNNQT